MTNRKRWVYIFRALLYLATPMVPVAYFQLTFKLMAGLLSGHFAISAILLVLLAALPGALNGIGTHFWLILFYYYRF